MHCASQCIFIASASGPPHLPPGETELPRNHIFCPRSKLRVSSSNKMQTPRNVPCAKALDVKLATRLPSARDLGRALCASPRRPGSGLLDLSPSKQHRQLPQALLLFLRQPILQFTKGGNHCPRPVFPEHQPREYPL